MWKLKNINIVPCRNNPEAIIKSSILLNYDSNKDEKTKAEIYMLLKATKFKLIPEYDFNCLYMKFDDEDEIYSVYDVTIDWLWFKFYKRYSIV